MVRFSFARDCGSIPHGDSTKHVFQYLFSLKLKNLHWLSVNSKVYSIFHFLLSIKNPLVNFQNVTYVERKTIDYFDLTVVFVIFENIDKFLQ